MNRKWIPKDKEPVWCWNDERPAYAEIRFYDAKNKCTFYGLGFRDGPEFNHYAPFTGELPPNMDPEKLED